MSEEGTVLIVEDDEAGRAMLALTLRQAGFRVLAAANGVEALEYISREPVRWLLTDGKMDPVDGFELSAKAKKLQPHLRIAMLSAIYTDRDIEQYPIETVFSKPVHPERLVSWLGDSAPPALPS